MSPDSDGPNNSPDGLIMDHYPQMIQSMLDKASTPALPTEEVMRLPLGQINKGKVAAMAMSAITE